MLLCKILYKILKYMFYILKFNTGGIECYFWEKQNNCEIEFNMVQTS